MRLIGQLWPMTREQTYSALNPHYPSKMTITILQYCLHFDRKVISIHFICAGTIRCVRVHCFVCFTLGEWFLYIWNTWVDFVWFVQKLFWLLPCINVSFCNLYIYHVGILWTRYHCIVPSAIPTAFFSKTGWSRVIWKERSRTQQTSGVSWQLYWVRMSFEIWFYTSILKYVKLDFYECFLKMC